MAVGVGRRVEPYEATSVEVEKLKRGDRLVEENRLVGVVIERQSTVFSGCRHNVHVKVDVSMGTGDPIVKNWCYTGGTHAHVIDI